MLEWLALNYKTQISSDPNQFKKKNQTFILTLVLILGANLIYASISSLSASVYGEIFNYIIAHINWNSLILNILMLSQFSELLKKNMVVVKVDAFAKSSLPAQVRPGAAGPVRAARFRGEAACCRTQSDDLRAPRGKLWKEARGRRATF